MVERRNFTQSILGAIFGSSATATVSEPKMKMRLIQGEALKPIEPMKVQIEFKRQPQIRVWKLGDLEHKIYPTQEAIKKLAENLKAWNGQGDLDLIWGPDLKVEAINVSPGDIDVVEDEQGRHIVVKGLENVNETANS